MIKALPAGRTLLPEGDFRAWAEIDTWADEIAHELAQAPVGRRTGEPRSEQGALIAVAPTSGRSMSGPNKCA